MKKKVMSIFLAAVMTAGVFAGCGTDKNADAGAGTDTQAYVQEDASEEIQKNEYISVYSREEGSGTRGAFVELFGIEQKNEAGEKVDYTTVEAVITNSTDVMMTSIAGNADGIGYVSLGSLNNTVKAVKIDGIEPTVENIKSNTYTVARPFNIATAGEVSDVTQDFINFIRSAEGQAIIEEKGYIPATEGSAFETNGAAGKIVVGGSSSVSPVMEKLSETYLEVNTSAEIELLTSDSSTGMSQAADGTLDIGMASREIKESELAAGLTGTTIAMDGIAVIVNKQNPVETLSPEQVKTIFTGEVEYWSEAVK